jgi:hypothetical protein
METVCDCALMGRSLAPTEEAAEGASPGRPRRLRHAASYQPTRVTAPSEACVTSAAYLARTPSR